MADLGAVFIARTWIPKLVGMLGRISAERRAKLDRISLDFPSPEELARYYVEPDCQRVNPADLPDGEVDEYRKPVFETIDDFLKKPSIDGGGANHRMILGDAGMGKSSLLVMLWKMHLFGFWPTDVDCTLLKLGSDTLEKIAEISVPSRHILLLDALDEDPSFPAASGGPKARLVELIAATTRFRKVVISCRTQFFVDEDNDPVFAKLGSVRLDGFVCPISYLSPFDDRQAKELLEKRFPNTWQRILFRPNKAREKAMSIADVMGSLSMRPLLLSYIPFLLGDDPHGESLVDLEGVDRDYQIYSVMITRWLDREVLKIKERGAAAVVPRSEDLRRVCWQVATMMRLDGIHKMPRSAFEELKGKLGVPEFLADDTLEGRALLNKDSAGNFRFAHSSIQEFLVIERCLTLGPFVLGPDSKCNLEPSALMQRFYEQRLRANLRSRILKLKSLCSGDFDQLVTRAAFAPGSLLLAAERLVGRRGEWDEGKPGGVSDLDKFAAAALLTELSGLNREATWNLLDGNNRVAFQEVRFRDLSGKLDRLNMLTKLDILDILDKVDAFVRLGRSGVSARLDILDVLEKLGILHGGCRLGSMGLSKLCDLDKSETLHEGRELDISGLVEKASTAASELAVGLLNLSLSEERLAQICIEELQTAWPTR